MVSPSQKRGNRVGVVGLHDLLDELKRKLEPAIVEIPIDWYFNADSKISVLRDSLRMFLDLLLIRRNARHGRYDPKP